MDQRIQKLVMQVHHRNGGRLETLDPNLKLLDASLLLDSLDLAEIMASIEKEFGRSPFDSPPPPKTWGDVEKGVGG